MTASYTYSDENNREENGTLFRWLVADSENGEYRALVNENSSSLAVTKDMIGKFIKVEVTPANAEATGLAVCGDNGRNRVIKLGDVDKNGVIDYVDALKTLQSIKGKIVLDPQSMAGADVIGDDGVNAIDVDMMLNVDVELSNLE